jgi:hypothetical protein
MIALQAGRAEVRLDVRYGTERQCIDGEGNTYFEVGPSRTVSSPSYVVEIADPWTPTVTATATVSPTTSSEDGGGDGCQLVRADAGMSSSWLSWLTVPLILAVRWWSITRPLQTARGLHSSHTPRAGCAPR